MLWRPLDWQSIGRTHFTKKSRVTGGLPIHREDPATTTTTTHYHHAHTQTHTNHHHHHHNPTPTHGVSKAEDREEPPPGLPKNPGPYLLSTVVWFTPRRQLPQAERRKPCLAKGRHRYLPYPPPLCVCVCGAACVRACLCVTNAKIRKQYFQCVRKYY